MNPDQNSIYGYPLTYSLMHFEKYLTLSPPDQAALLENARKFQNQEGSHWMSPDQLSHNLGGTSATWRQFLTLKPVIDYVSRLCLEDTAILNRQAAYKQATKAINNNDTQAAKYLQQLNELNQQQTNQQTIILCYIPRPTPPTPTTPATDEV